MVGGDKPEDSGDIDDGRGRIGEVIGEYRLTKVIGRGGMGTVYAGQHVRLGRVAAVKLLTPQLARDRKALQRFFAEAKIVAGLQHPNVVDVIDLVEGESPGIIMELLRGAVLSDVLRSGPLSLAHALDVTRQVLGVLALVHGRGIVHRDLKPHNLFLVDDGVRRDLVKVLDFGLAKLVDGQSFGVSTTNSGALLGTPLYMSPEQIEAQPVDARTDLYALGLIVFAMVTGRPPFAARSMSDLFRHHLLTAPPGLREACPDAPPALEAFVARCLAKRPDERFASAEQAHQSLFGGPTAAMREEELGFAETRLSGPMAVPSGDGVSGEESTMRQASGQVVGKAAATLAPTVPPPVGLLRSRPRRVAWWVAGAGLLGAAALGAAITWGRSSRRSATPASSPATGVLTAAAADAGVLATTAPSDAAVAVTTALDRVDAGTPPPQAGTTRGRPKSKRPTKPATVNAAPTDTRDLGKPSRPPGKPDAGTDILDR